MRGVRITEGSSGDGLAVGALGTVLVLRTGSGLHCPQQAVPSGVGQRVREEIKPPQQQETMNLVCLLTELRPTSCDVLPDRCGEGTGNVDETRFLTDSNNGHCCHNSA